MSDLPPAPRGAEWRRATAVQVGDVLDGDILGRVVSVDRKPKTVWITVEPAYPEDVPLMALGIEPKVNIRPRHDDYLAVHEARSRTRR